jgi:uncharacterized membrane protein
MADLPIRTNLLPVEVAASAAASRRLPIIDAGRGAALIAMFVFRFAWDLSYYDLISTDIGGSLPVFARLTAGSFLVLVGVCLVLSQGEGIRVKPYVRRLLLIGGAAALIKIDT